ncbi:MAG TPA: arsenate reductase ArsC [Burkholderiales bacterium]|nr:arsenate reductase ArsC [Burkholderiales bacterium]
MTAQTPKRLLFVCVENANRSQMAEAFARIHGGTHIEAYSAGSRPAGQINLKAIAAMQELGYDLTQHHSNSLSDIPNVEYDFVATMGCGDACPFVRAKRREDWNIPDPKHMELDEFRSVRDDIEQKVKSVLTTLLQEDVAPKDA